MFMYKIKIKGMLAASDAATWLQDHDYDCTMEMESFVPMPGRHIPSYIFTFNDPDHASHFALKWA